MCYFRIAVVGGRKFDDYRRMASVMNSFIDIHKEKDICIVSGGARGADSLAERYANENNIKLQVFPADWSRFGKVAGFIRNQEIIKAADRVIAFWDGKSAGTKHAIDEANKKDINVHVVGFGGYTKEKKKDASQPSLL